MAVGSSDRQGWRGTKGKAEPIGCAEREDLGSWDQVGGSRCVQVGAVMLGVTAPLNRVLPA